MAERSRTTQGTPGSRFKPRPAYTDSGVEWLREIPAHWEESPDEPDAEMIARGGPAAAIGMSNIKRRRVEQLDPELTYRGGQGPIVHLEADLHQVVAWTEACVRRWVFSLSNGRPSPPSTSAPRT